MSPKDSSDKGQEQQVSATSFARKSSYTPDETERVRWAVEKYLRAEGISVQKFWERMDAHFKKPGFEKELQQQDITNLRNGTRTSAFKLRLLVRFLEAEGAIYSAVFDEL